ncbi:MAG: hypothetical protein ACREVA_00030 [Burkholderiales bacterium]
MNALKFIGKTVGYGVVCLVAVVLFMTVYSAVGEVYEGVKLGLNQDQQLERLERIQTKEISELNTLISGEEATEPNTGISDATTASSAGRRTEEVDVQDEVEPPTEAAIKKARTVALGRCKTTFYEYGNAMVKRCVDADMRAFSSLWNYPQESKAAVNLCHKTFGDYGLSMVKRCVDSEMKATTELAEIEEMK